MKNKSLTYLLIILSFISVVLLTAVPAFAISPENSMFADPADFFPSCTCTVAFLGFVVWAVVLLVIAMFQYGEKRDKKLSRFWFSIIAIISALIIYTAPLWILASLLKPANFEVNPDTGTYQFSKYGEKVTESTNLTGEYEVEELEKHIRESRTYIVTTWAILAVACVAALATVPAYIRRLDKRREQVKAAKKKKRSSKGRIGTRRVKPKDDKKDKKEK